MNESQEPDIAELLPEHLEGSAFRALAANCSRTYYWSPSFEPDFYRSQARAGFIAVAYRAPIGEILLPELQAAYAVLDWPALHASSSTKRLLRPDYLELHDIRLLRSREALAIGRVLDELDAAWGADSWLLPKYRTLMEELAKSPTESFALEGTCLYCKGDLVAGELGYSIGAVYTSLSGFFHRERRRWNGLGIVQLHLLARELERAGYAFWNLGHPYMEYKRNLGAHTLSRSDFLARWQEAVSQAPHQHGTALG